jgi:hypothetical protein
MTNHEPSLEIDISAWVDVPFVTDMEPPSSIPIPVVGSFEISAPDPGLDASPYSGLVRRIDGDGAVWYSPPIVFDGGPRLPWPRPHQETGVVADRREAEA